MVKSIWIVTLVAGIGFAQGPNYHLSPKSNPTKAGDISFDQVQKKFTRWYSALGKDVKSLPVEVRFYDFSALNERAWRATTTVNSQEDSVISLDGTTGAFQYYNNLKIGREEETGKSVKTLPKSTYESRIKRLLKEFPFRSVAPIKLTMPRKGATPAVYTAVFETYKNAPIRDNFIHITLRDRDAALSYVIFNRKASEFATDAKINKPAAVAKKELVKLYPGKKIQDFGLWYARLQDDTNEFLSETARPVYIAEFENGVEAWIDAETGKVVRKDNWHGPAGG